MKQKDARRMAAMQMALDAASRSGSAKELNSDELARRARRIFRFLRKGK